MTLKFSPLFQRKNQSRLMFLGVQPGEYVRWEWRGSLTERTYLCEAWFFKVGTECSRILEDLWLLLCLKPKKSWRPRGYFLGLQWLINHRWQPLSEPEVGWKWGHTDGEGPAQGVRQVEKKRPEGDGRKTKDAGEVGLQGDLLSHLVLILWANLTFSSQMIGCYQV